MQSADLNYKISFSEQNHDYQSEYWPEETPKLDDASATSKANPNLIPHNAAQASFTDICYKLNTVKFLTSL
jgi:hypothetical protein